MIVRGLRDGQVLNKVFRIEQQSLGATPDCELRVSAHMLGKEPAVRRRYISCSKFDKSSDGSRRNRS